MIHAFFIGTFSFFLSYHIQVQSIVTIATKAQLDITMLSCVYAEDGGQSVKTTYVDFLGKIP